MFPYIYSCVEAKQGHVRLVKGLLIPFSFLPSASYPVYAFWSFYSSVVDLKAHLSALWLNRRLYGVVVYEGTSKVVEFVRTVGFISCCWGKIFHTTWLHSIGDLYHINIIIDFRKTSLKTQKSPYLHKMRQSPWFELIAHHLIFCSWSKLMSLIRGILRVMVWRAKKYVQ